MVVSDGPEADILKAGAGDNVRFLGYRSDTARLIMGYMTVPDMAARQGGQGRKLAVETFSIKAMVSGYEAVYYASGFTGSHSK